MTTFRSRVTGRYRLLLASFSPILLILVLIAFFPPQGKEGAQLVQFIGRFHPLTVHFPIALILLVPALELVGRFEQFSYLRLSSGFVLGLATMTAIGAAFLGWCLARTGGYSGPLVTQHMWGGITLTAVCWLCWILHGTEGPKAEKYFPVALTAGVLLVSWTGYRGGQISQGEEHLTEYMPSFLRHAIGLPDNTPLAQATADSFYVARVQPIFTERCVTCHGPNKQKSGLRLDSYGWLMRGGKHGAVVKAGSSQGSDLFRRVTLSPDQDDFMPKGKKEQAIPPDQLKLIEAWIGAGASGTLPLNAINNLPAGGSVAAAPIQVSFPEIDPVAVAKARESIAAAVAQLQKRLPNILDYESRNSADLVLNASLLGLKFGDSDLQAFAAVAEHIIVADFSRTAITDRAAAAIAGMKHLRVLRLAQTKITDETLKSLTSLDQLQSLNVYGTAVTPAALPLVEKLPKLDHFYAGQTAISPGISVPQSLMGKLVL